MRSAKFELVKRYYDEGLWNKTRVRNAVTKGWITEEEYDIIVNGEPVQEEESADQQQEEEQKAEEPEAEAEE